MRLWENSTSPEHLAKPELNWQTKCSYVTKILSTWNSGLLFVFLWPVKVSPVAYILWQQILTTIFRIFFQMFSVYFCSNTLKYVKVHRNMKFSFRQWLFCFQRHNSFQDYFAFKLIIIVTVLRCAALTFINIEKGFHTPKSLVQEVTQNLQHAVLLLCHWALLAHLQTVQKYIHKQLSHGNILWHSSNCIFLRGKIATTFHLN